MAENLFQIREKEIFETLKTNLNAKHVVNSFKNNLLVKFAECVFGPYQIVVYAESESKAELTDFIENTRTQRRITELDARMCKIIPGDEELKEFRLKLKESAVLLINVNYKEEKERNVTYNLRKVKGIIWARAMWGPADIVAIIEAKDHESMRNLICDEVKIMKGVSSNTTLYGYS